MGDFFLIKVFFATNDAALSCLYHILVLMFYSVLYLCCEKRLISYLRFHGLQCFVFML